MEALSMVQQADGTGRDELRRRVRAHVGAVAGGWARTRRFVDARGASRDRRAARAGEARGPGERVLELACGPGGVGLAAAELVGPGGEVVLSDVAPEMTAIARACGGPRPRATSAPVSSISSGSTSRTAPTTSCSAARG